MKNFKHTIAPDPEVLAVIVTCTEFTRLEDGRAKAKLDQGLEPPLAERTENVFRELGGQWDRYRSCMVLPEGIDHERVIYKMQTCTVDGSGMHKTRIVPATYHALIARTGVDP